MGNPSCLLFVPTSVAAIPIDWITVPEESKKYLTEGYRYDWRKKKSKPLPTTVGGLAQMFDETKFFGYFEPVLVTALMDISKFGLKRAHTDYGPGPRPVGPRFYMMAYERVWFFLFAPGTTDCHIVDSNHLFTGKDLDEMKVIAEAFDVKIEKNALRLVIPKLTAVLDGWTVSTAQSTLEATQFSEAIMTLPLSHPARATLLNMVLSSFNSGGPSKREHLNDDQELIEYPRKKAKEMDPEEPTGGETLQSPRLKKQKTTATAKEVDQEEPTTGRVTQHMAAAEKQKASGAATQKKNASQVKGKKTGRGHK